MRLKDRKRKESEGPNPIVIGQILVFKLILVLFLLFSVLYRAVALVVIIFKHFQHELWKKSLRTYVISKKRVFANFSKTNKPIGTMLYHKSKFFFIFLKCNRFWLIFLVIIFFRYYQLEGSKF